jgi:PKHD-type hydroxylase
MRPTWAIANRLFSASECSTIIEHERGRLSDGGVERKKSWMPASLVRKSKISWITPGTALDPLLGRAMQTVTNVALELYNVQLSDFEPPQFTHYGPLCHYGKHNDIVLNGPNRLVSAVVLLNSPEEFSGGRFWIDVPKGNWPDLKQGDMLVFPAYLKHQVRPVWTGERYSLVMWGHYRPPQLEKQSVPTEDEGAKND